MYSRLLDKFRGVNWTYSFMKLVVFPYFQVPFFNVRDIMLESKLTVHAKSEGEVRSIIIIADEHKSFPLY